MPPILIPLLLLIAIAAGLAGLLLLIANVFNPRRPGSVKQMPYESGMDPIHDTRRRFGVHFHLLAIAFLLFDVELLFLYPWAVTLQPASVPQSTPMTALAPGLSPIAPAESNPPPAVQPSTGIAPRPAFVAGLIFLGLLTLGFLYDWRKGVFQWR